MIIMGKVLDLDTFGEIMDKFIKDNEIKMLLRCRKEVLIL